MQIQADDKPGYHPGLKRRQRAGREEGVRASARVSWRGAHYTGVAARASYMRMDRPDAQFDIKDACCGMSRPAVEVSLRR